MKGDNQTRFCQSDFLRMLTLVIMILLFTACNKTNDEQAGGNDASISSDVYIDNEGEITSEDTDEGIDESSDESSDEEVSLSEDVTENDESDLEPLKVGMELKWPPFETTDTSGNPEGISVMIAEELGEYLGREIEIVDLPFSSLIPGLESQKIDVIISSMSITDERKEKIAFSDAYMYFKIMAIVNQNSGIENFDEIFTKEGVRFVAPKSFASLDIARERANNPTILEFDDNATAAFELSSGNADVFMVDAGSAYSIAANYPDDLMVFDEAVEASPIGMGVRQTDTELLASLNEFIAKTEELGVNDRIKDAYEDTLIESVGKGYDFYLNED